MSGDVEKSRASLDADALDYPRGANTKNGSVRRALSAFLRLRCVARWIERGDERVLGSSASINASRGSTFTMPKYVIERDVPGAGDLTDAQLREMSQKSLAAIHSLGHDIQWLHSYVTGDKVYCVYLAADESVVREHAKRAGIPANRISAVRRLLDATAAE
jgi:hypothetical protein